MSEDPRCEYEGCTKKADGKSLVVTAEKETYARYFCSEHKHVGAEALTHHVADILHKRIVRWDATPTGKWRREQEEAKSKREQEYALKEVEWAKEGFYHEGWKASMQSDDAVLRLEEVQVSKRDKITLALAQECYSQGWNAARKAEQEQGKAVFLLNEVVSQMEGAGEWYGTDFDEPIDLIKRALAEIKKGTNG